MMPGEMQNPPLIIQGGMGVAVSNWCLARAVSCLGQLGVVSGTALDQIVARRLEDGDVGGHMRRAFDAFPFPAMAKRVWDAYFIPGGKAADTPYTLLPLHGRDCPRALAELCLIANFA
jgi:nitronate monooxygenase